MVARMKNKPRHHPARGAIEAVAISSLKYHARLSLRAYAHQLRLSQVSSEMVAEEANGRIAFPPNHRDNHLNRRRLGPS